MIQIREKNQTEENLIYKCNSNEFGTDDISNVEKMLKNEPEKQIVINLSGVSSVKNSTLNLLKKIANENELSLCSLEADIFAAINLLNYDKDFHIFPSEESVIENRFELKNRKFKIV